jgi:vacuolar protein sorting-associated protein 13A/C
MFEKTVADVLSSALGAYIENLGVDQLSLGLFGGNISLRALKLRPSALEALRLPLALTAGCIGALDIHIPWTSLFSAPSTIVVRDVCILVRPDFDWTPVRLLDIYECRRRVYLLSMRKHCFFSLACSRL